MALAPTNSPFRLNRKPTTLNQYTAQGRTPAQVPAPQTQTQMPQYQVSRSDVMPTPQIGGVSGAYNRLSPAAPQSPQLQMQSSRPQTLSFPNASYTPPQSPFPSPATPGGAQTMGTAPNTRDAYLAGQGRLSGGDLAFGFGERARTLQDRMEAARRIAEAQPSARTVQETPFQVNRPQYVRDLQFATSTDPYDIAMRTGSWVSGGGLPPAPAQGVDSSDAIPVASGGSGSSAPFGGTGSGSGSIGSNRSSLVVEGSGADDTQSRASNVDPTATGSGTSGQYEAPPQDMNEYRRRLEREGAEAEKIGDTETAQKKYLQARRVAALEAAGYEVDYATGQIITPGGLLRGQQHGSIDDPSSWDDDIRNALSSGDYAGENNLLETGTERNARIADGLNLTPEQREMMDTLPDGVYVTETGRIKDTGDEDSDHGAINDPTSWDPMIQGIFRPYVEARAQEAAQRASKQAASDLAMLNETIGKPPSSTVDVEKLLQAQNERRAFDRAQQMRATMELASRTGMSPEASTGLSQGLMQSSSLAQRESEEKTRMMAKMQEVQNAIQHYKMQADLYLQFAQMQTSKESQDKALFAAAQARKEANRLAQEQMNMQRDMALMGAIGGGVGGLLGLGGSLLMGGVPGAAAAAGSSMAAPLTLGPVTDWAPYGTLA